MLHGQMDFEPDVEAGQVNAAHMKDVVQGERVHDGVGVVIAVLALGADAQHQVDLRGGDDLDAAAADARGVALGDVQGLRHHILDSLAVHLID